MHRTILLASMSSSSSGDSDSSNDSTFSMRKRKPGRKKAKASADNTIKGGPNKYECKGCSKVFRSLASRFVHTSKCTAYQKRKAELTCGWCNKTFPSKSALGLHAVEVHGDTSHKDVIVDPVTLNPVNNTCQICKKAYKSNILLKYHIRSAHFNLIGKVPYAEEKKVNQVWFEKVMNSNNIIEIKKTKHNTLVMKKINENTAIKVNSDNERIIDLSHMYPTGRFDTKVECQYCNKTIIRNKYQNHCNEVHFNIRNHHCNICNKSFKRNYLLKQHICHKAQKLKTNSNASNDNTSESLD